MARQLVLLCTNICSPSPSIGDRQGRGADVRLALASRLVWPSVDPCPNLLSHRLANQSEVTFWNEKP